MHRLVAAALAAAFVLAAAPFVGAAGGPTANQNAAAAFNGPTFDTSLALVQLKGDPLATYVKTKPAHGKKVDFTANATKSYRAQLSALRNDFKQWLQANAPKAKITGSWDLALNAVSVKLNGTRLSTLAAAPQAVHVEYQGLYHKTVDDPDLTLINAAAGWGLGTPPGGPNAGTGVKVAIVDSGIDQSHPCFNDAGYSAQTQLGDTHFTNNKVIVAKVFNMKTPSRGYTPEAINSHGTHVAGTVACNYLTPATVGGIDIPYDVSGVAPRALLGNYNIFPGDVENARSEDIVDALTAAYLDGMDTANLSMGGGARGIKDLMTMAVNNFDVANMLIAVAAGNDAEGNAVPPHLLPAGHYTIESPGSAERALTAGAFTVGHFVGVELTDDTVVHTYAAAVGDFGPDADTTAPLSANLGTYCDGAAGGSLSGKIALINRGDCTFSIKVRNAQDDGAVGAVIVENVFGPPDAMGSDNTPDQPTIDAVQVSQGDQAALAADAGDTFTIHSTATYLADSAQSNYVAGFSSQGPTDVDFRVKPDLSAPGVNVLSSIPMADCDHTVDAGGCFAFFGGTSMATPHLAGTAAVVKWIHPNWDAWEIRSAITNTADDGALKSAAGGLETDVNIIGAGRDNVASAGAAWVALDPVSVSFGAVPGGQGGTFAKTVTIENLKSFPYDYQLSVSGGGSGIHFSLSVTHINLTAGATGTFTVFMAADKGATIGDHQGRLAVSGVVGTYAHAVLYTLVKN